MRELKFRAYSNQYDEYIVIGFSLIGEVTCFNLIELWYIENKGVKEGLLDLVLHDVIIEQFTGLTDKNGKEIYEGDILSGYLDLGKSAVSFKNGSFMWNGELLGYDYTENGLDFFNTSQWATVIGNIHENSDLI